MRSKRCFTLIEMLVAIGVLTILGALIAQVISATSRGSHSSNQIVDSSGQARLVLDRLGMDLANMPKRTDMDYVFDAENKGDVLRFISQVSAPRGDRGVALVGYQMQNDSENKPFLARGVHGYEWNEAGFMGITSKGTPVSLLSLTGDLGLSDSEYDALSLGVLKVALSYQKKSDGKLYNKMPTYQSAGATLPALTNLASLVVSVAVVDLETRKQLQSKEFEMIQQRLGNAPEGVTSLEYWSGVADDDFKHFSEGLPPNAAKAVRFYQRFYPME
ncbi:MAG: type II secretion system protein [Verrucomicrobiota bacterium]